MVFSLNPQASKNIGRLFYNISSLGWISFGGVFLWFSFIFTKSEKNLKVRYIYPVIFALVLILVYKQYTGYLLADYIKQPYWWSYVWSKSVWKYVFYSYYFSFTLSGLYLIFSYGKSSGSLIKKRQSEIIFITGLIALIGGSWTNVVLQELNIHTIPPLAAAIVLVWASGLVYAMVRYKFLLVTPATAAGNIISTMADSLIILDRAGYIINVNNATSDVLDYKKRELIGNFFDMIIPSESNLLDKIIRGENIRNQESNFKTKGQEDIPVLLSTSVIKDDAGNIAGIVCIARNITEHKKMLETLRESEEKYRNLVESSNDGIVIVSGLTIKFVSQGMLKIFGCQRQDEMIGHAFTEFIVPAYRESMSRRGLARERDDSVPNRYEFKALRKDNTSFDAEISVSVLNRKGVRLRQGIIRDITERKRAELKLQEAYNELKQAQAQLIQSEKLAVVGQLATGVAHEINNPLSVISGEAEMLLKDKDKDKDKETEDTLKIIVEQSGRIKEITQRLLEFSQKRKFKQESLDINDILEKSISFLNYQAKMEGIKIVRNLDYNLPRVVGDNSQLQEVFLNIMLNAVQAMKDKGCLTIKTRKEEIREYGRRAMDKFKQGMKLAVIEFQDTGKGMDEETLKKIFDPFFSTKEKGTGLGLSICYRIIEAHQGTIEAHSKLGEGSAFIVKFPVRGGGR